MQQQKAQANHFCTENRFDLHANSQPEFGEQSVADNSHSSATSHIRQSENRERIEFGGAISKRSGIAYQHQAPAAPVQDFPLDENIDEERLRNEEKMLNYYKKKARIVDQENIDLRQTFSGKATDQTDLMGEQMRIYEDIQKRKEFEAKEREASEDFIRKLKIQDEAAVYTLVRNKSDQISVEKFNQDDEDGFKLVGGRNKKKKVGATNQVRITGYDEFMFPVLDLGVGNGDLSNERSSKEKIKLTEEKARENKKKEREVIEEDLKNQEKSRKVSLVTKAELENNKSHVIDEMKRTIPENINEILMTTEKRKFRREIRKSVNILSNMEQKYARCKDLRNEGLEFDKVRSDMGTELKTRIRLESESCKWVQEGELVYLVDQSEKKANHVDVNSEIVMKEGKAAAYKNQEKKTPSWKKQVHPGSSKKR